MEVIEKSVFTKTQNWKSEDCNDFCFCWIDYEKSREKGGGWGEGEHLCFRIMEINNILRITGNLKTEIVTTHHNLSVATRNVFCVCVFVPLLVIKPRHFRSMDARRSLRWSASIGVTLAFN